MPSTLARRAGVRARSSAPLHETGNLERMAALGVDVGKLIVMANRGGMDSFSNPMARIGAGTNSLAEAAFYPLTRITNDWYLLNSLYRNSWLIRRIIDTVAHDMTKAWIRINSSIDGKQIKAIQRVMQITRTRHAVTEAIKWARLYGGSGAVMILKGHDLETPLELDDVLPGDYCGLLVFDRWSGITPESIVYADLEMPTMFGQPEYYTCTTGETAKQIKVHSSRVLRFENRSLPQWERQAAMGWGESEVEIVYDEMKKRDNTSWAITNLIFRANLLAISGMEDAEMLWGTGTEQAKQRVQRATAAINQMMSNQGLLTLPKDAKVEGHAYSFGGVADVYQLFALDMSGAAEMPMTKLFGRTATGLGQSNEADEQMWEDKIATDQSFILRPEIEEKLMPVICMSTLGDVPDDFDWSFNPIHRASDREQAELADKKTTAVVNAYNAGIIGRKTAMTELRGMGEQTGLWTNITDQAIDDADDDPAMGMGDLALPAPGEKDGASGAGAVDKAENQREDKSDDEKE